MMLQVNRLKILFFPLLVLASVSFLIFNEMTIRQDFTYKSWWDSWDMIPRDPNKSQRIFEKEYFNSLTQSRIDHLHNTCDMISNKSEENGLSTQFTDASGLCK